MQVYIQCSQRNTKRIIQSANMHAVKLHNYNIAQLVMIKCRGQQQLSWHGNSEVPGLVPGFNSWLLLCFLGQETSPQPQPPSCQTGTYYHCMQQGTAEEQPMAEAVIPVKITCQKKISFLKFLWHIIQACMCTLCRNNFWNNWWQKESGIIPE